MFLIVALLVFALLHTWLWHRTNAMLHLAGLGRIALVLAIVLLAGSYFVGRLLLAQSGSERLARWFELVGASWMGVLGLAFSVFVLLEVTSVMTYLVTLGIGRGRGLWFHLSTMPVAWQRIVGTAIWGLIFLGAAHGAWAARHGLTVTKLIVEVPGLSDEVVGKRLVQITDTHFGSISSTAMWQERFDRMESLNPSAILITGDFIEDRSSQTEALVRALAERFGKIPRYAVTGNHEYYAGTAFFLEQMDRYGYTLLRNRSIKLDASLHLGGIDDLHYRDVGEATASVRQGVPESASLILLSHRPIVLDNLCDRPATLVLAGHVHGGQLPPFQVLSPLGNRGFLSGIYPCKGATMYLSRGTGTWGPPMRLFAPPEIVLLELRRGNEFRVRKDE